MNDVIHHELKTETRYYQAVENKLKTFEVRKNDRDYKCFDMVTLIEVVNGIETGRKLDGFKIIYILEGGQYGIDPDYVVLQLRSTR